MCSGGEVHSETRPPLAVGQEAVDDDGDTLLLPPGTSFLVAEDAVEATGLRVVTLMHIGEWLDSEILSLPAVQQAQRDLEAAARTHRNALRIHDFQEAQLKLESEGVKKAPVPEQVQEITSETEDELVVFADGVYYRVEKASDEVFIKETDGSWSVVGTWDAELRRATFA